jgi:chromosome segregation protein
MYLKRLDIHGFKTFPQRATFTFPPGITAVVGPNGSGKSNVADAVRWVLGEQSFTNLRSKKTEDLVFGGGKGRAPMGFAEVSLTIDNSDRTLPLPYDEVTLGRRAYRNGENEYFINRARVRLRDLLDAVAPLGSSFTLINQGYVDAALALQPEDRQRLIEDAAGIGPYQARKTESERRLRETEANLVRLHDLLQEQEPQLRALRRQARDAEAVDAVEAELRGLQERHYAHLWTTAQRAWREATEHEQQLRVAAERSRAQQTEAAATLQAAREAVRGQRETLATVREREADLDRRIAATMRERAVADERRAGLIRRVDELRGREQATRDAHAAAAGDVAALHSDTERAEAALVEQREMLAARMRATEALFRARAEADQTLEAARAEWTRVSGALSVLETRTVQLRRQHQAATSDVATLETAIGRAEERMEAARARAEAAERALREAEDTWHAAERALDEAHHRMRAAHERRAEADDALQAARRAEHDLQLRSEALGRLRHTWEGMYPGVRAAMRWAAKEGHDDFALVSSVIDTPPELETAVETALGARLQNIVVERWEDAEAAITALKRDGAGRATFLPLDTIQEPRSPTNRHERALALAGIRGRAADMVGCAQRYRAVVELLLGRTLIADDLRAARQALGALEGGATLVTLAGEQVAASGALTGGSTRGEGGTLRREREYRALPGRIADAQAEVAACAQRLSEHEATVAAETAAMRAAEGALRERRRARDQQQTALESSRRDAHREADELVALRGRRERALATQAAAQREVEAADAEWGKLQEQRAMVEEAVAAAQAAYDLRRTEAQAEDTNLRQLRDALAVAEAEGRARADALVVRRRALQAAEQEGRTLAGEIDAAQADLAAGERAAAELHAASDELAALAEAVRSEREPLEAATRTAETDLETLERAERAAMNTALADERRHADALLAAERANGTLFALRERASADGIVVEQLRVDGNAAEPGLPERIAQLETRLRRMGPVNALAPEEYAALQERHAFTSEQLADVRSAAATLREAIRELDELMDTQFDRTFGAVAQEFSATFTQLFGGGTARLALVGGQNGVDGNGTPARRGIEIVAQPPGKRQLHLQLLSGGERALTAGALLFAILKHQPRPFCILDEVDAALDESNVVRFREMLAELAADTQFIVITHNRGTVEAADTLYGITMGEDSGSRVLSLRFVPGEDELVGDGE